MAQATLCHFFFGVVKHCELSKDSKLWRLIRSPFLLLPLNKFAFNS
jgi:hypothetical protein